MHDAAIRTPGGLSASEAAVSYLIQRLRLDADLRHHMLHTEALARLCEAEAARTGTSAEAIHGEIEAAPIQERARIIGCRQALSRIYNLAAECLDRGTARAAETLRLIRDEAEKAGG